MRRRCRGLLFVLVVGLAGCAGIRESELQRAIKAHDATQVRELMAAGASLLPTMAEPLDAVELALWSVEDGNAASLEILRLMIEANPQPVYFGIEAARPPPRRLADATFPTRRGKEIDGKMPYTAAIEIVTMRGSVEAVQMLLDAGLTVRSEGTTNALVDAAGSGRREIAELLLAAGADVNGRSTKDIPLRYPLLGSTPLEAATPEGDRAMIALLIAHGARN